MKRKTVWAILAVMILASLLGGCTSKKDLENEKAYRQIGINDLENGDYEDAVKQFQNALNQKVGKITNLEIDICYYKALAQFKNGDYEDAIETYTGLIEYDDEDADAYFLRGNVYLQNDDIDNATADFKKAVNVAEDYGKMSNQIAESLIGAGENDMAQTYLNAVIQKGGDSDEDLYNIGYAYYLQEDYGKAENYLSEAKSNGYEDAVLTLAKVYLANDETGNATALMEEYTESHSEDGEALNIAGCISMKNNDYETAISYFEKGLAIENVENQQELMKNEIAAYEYSGDFETAYSKMQDYLKVYPEDEQAVRENTFLETRISNGES